MSLHYVHSKADGISSLLHRRLRVWRVGEGDEAVALGLVGQVVTHHATIGNVTVRSECLSKSFAVHLGTLRSSSVGRTSKSVLQENTFINFTQEWHKCPFLLSALGKRCFDYTSVNVGSIVSRFGACVLYSSADAVLYYEQLNAKHNKWFTG